MSILADSINRFRDCLLVNGVPFKEHFNSELREFSIDKSYFGIEERRTIGTCIHFYSDGYYAVIDLFAQSSMNIRKHDGIPQFLSMLNKKFPQSKFIRQGETFEVDPYNIEDQSPTFQSYIQIRNDHLFKLSDQYDPEELLSFVTVIAKDTEEARHLFNGYLER